VSILLNESSRVIVQGITGREGSFHTQQMKLMGTAVVGGVTPGRGGEEFEGTPVFNTVADAVLGGHRAKVFFAGTDDPSTLDYVSRVAGTEHVAQRGWSVALLESRRVAWNASGRNDGFVLPGFAQSMDKIISRVGLDHAKALWALSEMGLNYVRATIAELRMPGVAPVAGWLKVSKVDNGDDVLADVQLYREELGAEVEGWPTERVRDVLRSRHYFHALHLPQAFHIHPLNYALGLAEAAEAAGVRIFEGTQALAIDPAGVRKRVTTPSGRVRASHIVLACNVQLGRLLPRIAGTLVPVWSYVITTHHLGAQLAEAVSYRGAVTDTDLADNHYRIVDGDRLLWSGRSTTWEVDPARFASRLRPTQIA